MNQEANPIKRFLPPSQFTGFARRLRIEDVEPMTVEEIRQSRGHHWELIETKTNNVIGWYGAQSYAYAEILDAYQQYGEQGVESLVLFEHWPGGRTVVRDGTNLLAWCKRRR